MTPLDTDLAGLADVRAKARAAQRAFSELEGAAQETLDRFVRALALAGTKAAEELARLAVDETGYGVYEH
jgi:acetaldehyde dehydrogenase (acetylating)